MATELTQDAVLRFLQSGGGSVKNSDLLLHFRGFLRDAADQQRNRDLFKRFVNTVATVRQENGVSHVVLRKKFRSHVPGGAAAGGGGGGGGGAGGGGAGSSGLHAGRIGAPAPVSARDEPRVRAPLREETPAAPAQPAVGTVLPSAGFVLGNNNNNVETNLNLKREPAQATTSAPARRPAAAAAARQAPASEKMAPVSSGGTAPPPDRRREGGPSPGRIPAAAAAAAAAAGGQVSLPGPLALSMGNPAPPPPGPPLHPQVAPRLCRHRPSYKSAVSCDEDEDDDDEEDLPLRTGTRGGAWPLSSSLALSDRAISASSPCILDQPPGRSVPSSSSSSSGRELPAIHIQNAKGETLPPSGPGWSMASGQRSGFEAGGSQGMSVRRSSTQPPDRSEEMAPRHSALTDQQHHPQAAGAPEEPRQGRGQTPRARLSSSHSSVFAASDVGFPRGGWPPPAPPAPGWISSCDDLQVRAGDLYDDRESSEDSASSPLARQHLAVARHPSSRQRRRMCRSLGANLDQLLHEGAGGSEAARLHRLHLLSSSLSLRHNLSSSSLSSCSTPPRCHSPADLLEGVEGRGGGSLPASGAHQEGSSRQSLVPLEPREHAWLVKGAAGDWPDIYSLFREDSSLLNRRDFISGFTVLHWIAKHGDHRVLNTLWYGVQKAGLTLDVNARSTCGHAPLHIAAIHNNKNIVRLLVNKFGADVKLRDTAGKRPWQYLSPHAAPDLFQILGAPSRPPGGAAPAADSSFEEKPHRQRRRRHRFSTAGDRPLPAAGAAKVKRSSSIAAFLKHRSLGRFHGHADAAV